jgi:hypothetical protein
MSIYNETIWERFFNRLPETAANEAIRVLKQGGSFKDVDFFTMKEAEAQVGHYRERAKAAIGAYKRWKSARAVTSLFGVFRDREGAHLRAHARAMTGLFLDSRRDFADLSALLMESVSNDRPDHGASVQGGRHE